VWASGRARAGFPTQSRRLELYSPTMADWLWPEYATPCYIPSHVDEANLDRARGEMVLVSTFRLPTMIHTRSANSKWLSELSNTNLALTSTTGYAAHIYFPTNIAIPALPAGTNLLAVAASGSRVIC